MFLKYIKLYLSKLTTAQPIEVHHLIKADGFTRNGRLTSPECA